jgi:hypothetical protein
MKRILLGLLCALSASRSLAQTCSPTTFQTSTQYLVGGGPLSVAVGDFNNDTILDVALPNVNDSMAVLPGVGDGTFGSPIGTSDDISSPLYTVAGHFDGGANLDLAIDTYDGFYTFPGNGDGTFQNPTFTSVPFQPTGFVTADFNGDGKPDIATTGGYANAIRIFLGNGDGSFSEQPPITGFGFIGALAAGDLNGGGIVDLVAASGPGVVIWPGQGNGSFGAPIPLKIGGGVNAIALGDLDGDGIADVAAGVGNFVAVFHNNGNGTFLAGVEYPLTFTSNQVAIGDVDGDGLNDLVSLYGQQYYGTLGVVSVLLQKPDGTLQPASNFSAGNSSVAMGVADFNTDGRADVVVANYGDGTASALLATGDGNLRGIRVSTIPVTWSALASGDFDGDGLTDFLALAPGSLTFLPSDGEGHLSVGPVTPVSATSPAGLLAADLDGDGKLDAVASDYNEQVAVLLGHGDGSFDPPTYYSTSGFGTSFGVSGDFNGDGKLDFAVFNYNSGNVDVFLNQGAGTFANAGNFLVTHSPANFVSADLNADGFADLVIPNGACCNAAASVSVFLSNGDGTFQPAVDYPTGTFPLWAATGDFNEDGKPDLVTANSNAANLSLLLGDGNGGFLPPSLVAIGFPAISVETGFFDPDGHADVVAISGGSLNRATLLRGVGNGTFQLPEGYTVGSNSYRIFPGTFDPGPAEDAAILNGDGTLSTLINARLTAEVASVSVIVGSTAVLHADASGFGPVTYQWRRNGVPLSDGGPISGATTATLTIDPVAFTDAGSYDVLVSDSCTDGASNAATLSVEFDDVPLDNPFHADIITIATAGITGGCTPTSFCPSNDVSRAEMAVFLLKSKFGADHVPPPPVQVFPDVPNDAFAAAWIDELAALQITGGCGGGLYCPDRPISRGEMAVLLLKTLLGSDYVPPPPAGIFADVPLDSFAIAWIEDLYNRGITAGCGTNPLTFCPDANVPREQMATFLVRTFLGP